MISEPEFQALATQGFNRIPLMAQAFADLETPLSLYLKLAHMPGESGVVDIDTGKNSFLLESVVGGERFGRYSFIGLPARTLLRASGFGANARTEVVTDGVVVETSTANPLDFIAGYQKRFKVALRPGLPRFCGGLAGYFGYDAVRYIEKKLEASCPPDELGCPDILLLQCEELAVIDNLSGKLYLIVYADPGQSEAYSRAKRRLRQLKDRLAQAVNIPAVKPTPGYPAQRDFAKADYIAAVERAKELIAGGDFMQVQVGQRIKKRYTESPLSLYRALRSLNPSPYMYYYHFGDFHVVGASPEILVRQEQVNVEGAPATKVTIRPLAGTRPRGATPELDKAAETELVNDPKERAEHVMLIDLARNDIGRIAQIGSVKVSDAFCVERYSHVMHIVSNVEGTLKDGMTSMDVLKATFP
ncbi:MAG TPA: chorismate-binding protein, partial [Rhodoferax sp.]|nr:chorismate-binding protein [Rhodoferax sp.]